jgi:hypothetical protein
LHVPHPDVKQGKHPLYEAEQRKHFGARYSEQFNWKSTLKIVPGNKPSKCIDEWVPNNKPPREFT